MSEETLLEQEVEQKEPNIVICGHINKHHNNVDGELEDLKCELPAGHQGDHQADYLCFRATNGSVKQAKQIAQAQVEGRAITIFVSGKELIETVEKSYWSDGASVPAADIKPDLEQLKRLKASKGDMLDEAQILRNPNAL